MAALTTAAIVAGTASLATAGTGIATSIAEGKRRKQYERYLEDYQRQTLTNPYEGLQVSTLGADRQREDLARTMSTFSNQAAQGGSRAIVGLTPNATQQFMDSEAKIMADLDQQYRQNQQLQAQGQAQVQQMQEQREQNDLLGIGNAINVASQNQNNARTMIAQGLMGLGKAAGAGMFNGIGGGGGLGATPQSLDTGVRMGLQGVDVTQQPVNFSPAQPFSMTTPNPYLNYSWMNSQVKNTLPRI